MQNHQQTQSPNENLIRSRDLFFVLDCRLGTGSVDGPSNFDGGS